MYVDAAYCYGQSGMVCRSVMIVSLAEMAEPLEVLFGMWTWGGPEEPCTRWACTLAPLGE